MCRSLKSLSSGVRHGLPPHQPEQGRASPGGQLATEEDIFGRGECADQRQVLVDRFDRAVWASAAAQG